MDLQDGIQQYDDTDTGAKTVVPIAYLATRFVTSDMPRSVLTLFKWFCSGGALSNNIDDLAIIQQS